MPQPQHLVCRAWHLLDSLGWFSHIKEDEVVHYNYSSDCSGVEATLFGLRYAGVYILLP
jgi:hypothetical protein